MFEFIAQAAVFENRMDEYIHMDLSLPALNLTDDRHVMWEDADSTIASIDFVKVDGAPQRSAPPAVPRVPPPAPAPVASTPPPAPPTPPPPAPQPSPKTQSPDGSNAIYVNGLSRGTTEADIREAFVKFGDIKLVNGRHVSSGGFAFVFFEYAESAQRALADPRVPVKNSTCNVLCK